jgi:hypothetical protein
VFGGNVLALQLDVDFSDAGVLGGTSGLAFGDLRMCNFTTLSALNGMTVRQYLALVNTLLGGGTGRVLDRRSQPGHIRADASIPRRRAVDVRPAAACSTARACPI